MPPKGKGKEKEKKKKPPARNGRQKNSSAMHMHQKKKQRINNANFQSSGNPARPYLYISLPLLMRPLNRLPLLDREVVLGPDPAPRPPRAPLLPLLHALHPRVPSFQPGLLDVRPRTLFLVVGVGAAAAAAGRRRRYVQRADVDLVAALALQRLVARQHVQVPEREAGRQAGLFAEGDGLGEFEEAEEGFAFFGAHADADEFDFRDEEAVARVALAHQAVQVGEAGEVERLLAVLFLAHARVPDVVGLDEADDAAAAEDLGLVVGVRGQKKGAIFFAQFGNHGDVMLVALAGPEGRIDFGGVERGNGVLKCAFVGGLDQWLTVLGHCQSCGWNGDIEKAGAFFAVRKVGNSHDSFKVEVFPIFQIAYVPPAMHMVANAYGDLPY